MSRFPWWGEGTREAGAHIVFPNEPYVSTLAKSAEEILNACQAVCNPYKTYEVDNWRWCGENGRTFDVPEFAMNPLVAIAQEFFRFLLNASYGKFLTFLVFLLVLFGMLRLVN